jgi:hypothetical protein
MAHWAEIDENNVVLRVLVTDNDLPDEGHQWLVDNLGGTWLKTSYNTKHHEHSQGGTPFRGNYAGPGGTYDPDADVFIPPKPYNTWILDETIHDWVPPVPAPEEGAWYWDDESAAWVEA